MDRDALLNEVEATLRGERRGLAFSPALEARYEQDAGQRRSRHMVLFGAIAVLIYNLFLINDYSWRAEVFDVALWARLGLATPYSLLVLWLVWRGLTPAWREGLLGSTICVVTLSSCLIFRFTTSPDVIVDPFTFSLILLVGNIFLVLRFWAAAASTAVCLGIVLVFVSAHPAIDTDLMVFLFFVYLAFAVFTLLANLRLERLERESYLRLLRESLRGEKTRSRNRDLTRLSLTDALTGLPNRRHLDRFSERLWEEGVASSQPIGVLIVDIDHFKPFNDHYGHQQGDVCLRQVADAIQGSTRLDVDFVARYGGEEFVVLLLGASEDQAFETGERIRRGVRALKIPHAAGPEGQILTVSVGVSVVQPAPEITFEQVFRDADRALYAAKQAGRDRTTIARPDPS